MVVERRRARAADSRPRPRVHRRGPRRVCQLIETLREYAACDLNARRAATALFVHRNTVLYRLQRIEELSGLDPHVLPELVDLMAAVRLTEGAQATAAAIARPATRPEKTAAEERALECPVAVHAAAPEAGDLAGRVEAGQRLPSAPRTRASRSVCSPPRVLRVRMCRRTAIRGPASGSRMRCGAATRIRRSAR